jgi:hypothetical protein
VSSRDRALYLARLAYWAVAWTFVACVVVQLFLVGLDAFEVIGDNAALHRGFAYLYGWLVPMLVLLATIGRQPRARQVVTVLLLALFAVQTYLPSLREGAPLAASLHAVNALAIFAAAVWLANGSRDQLHPIPPTGG